MKLKSILASCIFILASCQPDSYSGAKIIETKYPDTEVMYSPYHECYYMRTHNGAIYFLHITEGDHPTEPTQIFPANK